MDFDFDDATNQRISSYLADISYVKNTVFKLDPDYLSIPFGPESNIPLASICLQDYANTMQSVNYGLSLAHSWKIYYREKLKEPNEDAAIVTMKYYIEDVAFRLYSAAEYLANSIIMMLDIPPSDLTEYRKTPNSSLKIIVGLYLVDNYPDNPITKAIISLKDSIYWKKANSYRNDLVHYQPPTIKNLGIVYKARKKNQAWVNRWEKTSSDLNQEVFGLSAGGGDTADYFIDELLDIVQHANFELVDTSNVIVKSYVSLLASYGIKLTETGFTI